ncbi:MAG: hypothetical protein ACREMG_09650, partial [Gemmatimonadales bacterium]
SGLHKLVLISGDTASVEVVEFMGRIRQPIIQKPFDMRALADLLDQTAPPRSSAASTPPLPPTRPPAASAAP